MSTCQMDQRAPRTDGRLTRKMAPNKTRDSRAFRLGKADVHQGEGLFTTASDL